MNYSPHLFTPIYSWRNWSPVALLRRGVSNGGQPVEVHFVGRILLSLGGWLPVHKLRLGVGFERKTMWGRDRMISWRWEERAWNSKNKSRTSVPEEWMDGPVAGDVSEPAKGVRRIWLGGTIVFVLRTFCLNPRIGTPCQMLGWADVTFYWSHASGTFGM